MKPYPALKILNEACVSFHELMTREHMTIILWAHRNGNQKLLFQEDSKKLTLGSLKRTNPEQRERNICPYFRVNAAAHTFPTTPAVSLRECHYFIYLYVSVHSFQSLFFVPGFCSC